MGYDDSIWISKGSGVVGMQGISDAVKILKKGGVVIYPTETCYGLGADATNRKAIEKIYKIKGREKGNPVTIIVSSLAMAKKYCIIDKRAEILAKKFMPGPLTLVVKKKRLPDNLCKDTIGFRIPGHPVALALAKKLGRPVTATSANMSGQKPVYRFAELEALAKKADYIVYGGDLPEIPPSTVFSVAENKILRQGCIAAAEIEKA